MMNSILVRRCMWSTLATLVAGCAPVDEISMSAEVLGESFSLEDGVAHDSGFNGLLLTLFERSVGCNVEVVPDEKVVVLQFVDNAAFAGVGDYEDASGARFEVVYFDRACDQDAAKRSDEGKGEILTFTGEQVSGIFEGSSDEGEVQGDFDVPMCEGNAPALPSSCD